MQATARLASVVSSTLLPRRRLIRVVRRNPLTPVKAATNHPGSNAPSFFGSAVTPFWFDAVIATVIAHLAFAVHLRVTGWSNMTVEWLKLPREPWWWLVYFLPGFAVLLFVAFRSRRLHSGPLALATFMLYIAIVILTPRMSE